MAVFEFKKFSVDDSGCGMKVCSDSVLLAAWFFPNHSEAQSIVDVGAGSGVLALLGAECCPDAAVIGLELDSGAASAAEANFKSSPWSDRMQLVEGDFALWNPSAPVDLIISNPPYFTEGAHSADSARAAARHQDGLSYASLLRFGASRLSKAGALGLVSPAEFENDIVFEAEMAGLKLRRILRVRTSPRKPVTRLLFEFSRTDGPVDDRTLALRNPDGSLTAEYRALVEPFYKKI